MTHAMLQSPQSISPNWTTLRTVRDAEYEIRTRLDQFETESQEQDEELSHEQLAHLLYMCTFTLEMTLLVACLAEMAHEKEIVYFGDLIRHFPEALKSLQRRTRISNIEMIVKEHNEYLGKINQKYPSEREVKSQKFPSMRTWIRQANSVIASCPILEIEMIARDVGNPESGHRCRVAYDAIRAFVRRSDITKAERTNAVGEAYASGKITITDASRILGITTSDAIAEFEKNGYWRRPDQARLSPSELESALELIRKDMETRGGEPSFSEDLLRRDVIASERIESVDARRWIHEIKS